MGNTRGAYRILLVGPEGKRPFGRGIYGNIILKSVFKKWDGEAWNGLSWLRIGTGGGRF
jgi:hypothetical protein